MTAAERQRRRRKRLRQEKRQAEVEALQQRNEEKNREWRQKHTGHPLWTVVKTPTDPPLPSPADELALQIDDAIRADPDVLNIKDIRAAIDRRFGQPE